MKFDERNSHLSKPLVSIKVLAVSTGSCESFQNSIFRQVLITDGISNFLNRELRGHFGRSKINCVIKSAQIQGWGEAEFINLIECWYPSTLPCWFKCEVSRNSGWRLVVWMHQTRCGSWLHRLQVVKRPRIWSVTVNTTIHGANSADLELWVCLSPMVWLQQRPKRG